ncbi:putative ABC transporter B family member 8 [Amaranthus tricolor]|uniref:putative ABC transporter B family member 8 n=1 Tax=Amaranthus tricolor TaxID=29722 RepID=UPI0025828CCA|nr:putative ABC transporter B family member 8 [Amaranthus tricolor]
MEEEKIRNERKKRNSLGIILRYADWIDYLLMISGAFGALGDGMSTNILLIFASKIMNSLGFGQNTQGANTNTFMSEVEKCSLYFVYLGLAIMVVAFLEGYCWSKTSERQVLRIRYKYLEAILRQEVGFFDSQEATTSEVVNSISKDTSLIQEALSEKVPIFLMHSSSFLSGMAFSAYFSWRLAIVAFPTVILLLIPGMIYGKYLLFLTKKSYKEYSKANTIIGEALSSIKTVYSFTAEKNILEKYSSILETTMKLGVKQGIAKGMAVGSTGLAFAIWAFLAWYGSRLVMYHGETGGRIYASSVTFIMGGLSLGSALPEMRHFTEASVAASRIFERIDRTPQIDEAEKGLILDTIKGEIQFEHVNFTYPSRPDTLILKDFDLKVEAGKTVALVGASGSGKSTAIALLQRFYDSNEGFVKIDGIDITSLKLKWIRGQMGLVSQDHAMFGTSIKENIMFGKLDATMDEVIGAAQAANAHNFIRQLPDGYETKIGERGALLSGGQKQRIAIARAIIKNPVILLLDEATSALDSESEKLVQNALDQASLGRTTLVVAHKLSTVKNADMIAVINDGQIMETGSHTDLINKNGGHYAKLTKMQKQLSYNEMDHSYEPGVTSSVPRSAGRLSTARSSPAVFNTPLPEFEDPKSSTISHPAPSFLRLLSLNSPEWKQGLIGSFSAIIFGAVQPTYALTIGSMISAFFVMDHEEMKLRIRKYCLIFSFLSFVSILFNLIQHSSFAYMGERLTKRIRLKMLEKILSFETAWFDEEENSSGALCSRLSNEAAMVKSLVADRVSLLVQTMAAVTIAMIMGLITAWKLALVMIAVQPITILCFYTRKVLLSSITNNFVKAQNLSTQIAVEAVYNHRIVASYGSIGKVLEIFNEAQNEPRKEGRKKSWLAGIGMGSAQGLTFMCWALDFWYGGRLVEMKEISAGDVFKTFFVLVSTGKVIAEAGSMTSDLAKGSAAVASVFHILDRCSLIPTPSASMENKGSPPGTKLESITGRIELRKVDFAYPTRPESPILRQFSLEVKAATSVGLVGKSGCGKSTVIALIQRFYDVDRGAVKVDGLDIRELDVAWYRNHMALVSQDPVIYSGSIRDNILLGRVDATENEVIEASRAANAHEFICSLKEGYQTECGERGLQLSGGQKQRLAIARAILRNPTVLLLDEATSALDLQSEKMVQEALDRVMVGRTTIVVAHHLNTIKNLDCIAFVEDGKVVEQGTYTQLKHKRGAFFNLASLQTLT